MFINILIACTATVLIISLSWWVVWSFVLGHYKVCRELAQLFVEEHQAQKPVRPRSRPLVIVRSGTTMQVTNYQVKAAQQQQQIFQLRSILEASSTKSTHTQPHPAPIPSQPLPKQSLAHHNQTILSPRWCGSPMIFENYAHCWLYLNNNTIKLTFESLSVARNRFESPISRVLNGQRVFCVANQKRDV